MRVKKEKMFIPPTNKKAKRRKPSSLLSNHKILEYYTEVTGGTAPFSPHFRAVTRDSVSTTASGMSAARAYRASV